MSFPEKKAISKLKHVERVLGQKLLSTPANGLEDWLALKALGKSCIIRAAGRGGIGAEERKGFSEDEASRARLARVIEVIPLFSRVSQALGVGLTLAYKVIPGNIKKQVAHVLNSICVPRIVDDDKMLEVLKELGRVAKKYGDILFPGYWKWLVDMNTVAGYRVSKPEAVETELVSWLGNAQWQLAGGASMWGWFSKGCKDFLSELPGLQRANEKAMTILEWASDPEHWGRAGSTMEKWGIGSSSELHYTSSSGEQVPAARSKWRCALLTPTATVVSILKGKKWKRWRNTRVGQLNRCIEKREPTKVRLVVSSDEYLYIRMSYVSHWIERALSGCVKTPLFMSLEQRLAMWEEICVLSGSLWNLPVDQSHFDWHVSFTMLSFCMDALDDAVARYAPPRVRRDLSNVLRDIRTSLVGQAQKIVVYADKGKDSFLHVKSGVASGWRWTAFLDTMINWAETYTVGKLTELRGGSNPMTYVKVQGDDDCLKGNHIAGMAACFLGYEALNLEVNAAKTFLQKGRDEFLRQVAVNDASGRNISGYPLRVLNSILWRNPVNDPDEIRGVNKIVERLNVWHTLYNRGAKDEEIYALMVTDLFRAANESFSKQEIKNWLHTPASFGGAGILPYGDSWCSFVAERRATRTKWIGKLPALDTLSARAASYGVELDTSAICSAVLPTPQAKSVIEEPAAMRPTAVVPPPTQRNTRSHFLSKGYSAEWLEESGWIREAIVMEAKRRRDPNLCKPYMTPVSRARLSALLRACRKRVVWDWLTDSLSWSLPFDKRFGMEYVSYVTTSFFNGWLQSNLWRRNISYDTVRLANYRFECVEYTAYSGNAILTIGS